MLITPVQNLKSAVSAHAVPGSAVPRCLGAFRRSPSDVLSLAQEPAAAPGVSAGWEYPLPWRDTLFQVKQESFHHLS